ncbi:hypothetical protein SAMN05216223_101141 [Actinacidiphila yanglinensis]|uniref:Secreted protein n=1 Tax=Actinacidiphila yanglinensis TaxID=310779 RepID=A0A1H5SKE9_9ACTN|nr:hypothetical protein [Actinacidiphila yanglinensis]SEF50291.1 hypothetical protein SAMN05216223_101141 [Actinacidiphila yanglinensis]
MSTGAVAAIVVAVLVVIAVVAVWTMSGGAPRSGRLKHRFGPEYERTLAQHDGDAKAAGKELSDRVKRYGGLERRPLSAAEREQYTARWRAVQAQFVEDPAKALHQADQLVAQVAKERGFPAAGSPEHFDALSVHHATPLQGYRRAHALAEHASAGGEGATEDLRQSLIGARGLFDELLGDSGSASTRTRPAQAPDTPDAEPAPERPRAEAESAPEPVGVGAGKQSDEDAESTEDGAGRSTLGHRFAALTGSVRKSDDGSGRA